MSPRKSPDPLSDRMAQTARRLATEIGSEIHDERVRRHWTLRELGRRSGVTGAAVQRLEAGHPGNVETYARVSVALTRRPELHLVDDRRLAVQRAEDPVHAWMGDVEAAHLQSHGLPVAIDEPFQHYQFAGRADVLSGQSSGGHCSTSRIGRGFRTFRTRPGATTRNARTWRRRSRSG